MTGRPLTKMHRSSDSFVASGEKWSWRVTLKMFFAYCGGGVIYAGRHIEHDEADGISLDAFAQHVNNAALGDFIADTGEKLRRFLWIGFQLALFHRVRLSVF